MRSSGVLLSSVVGGHQCFEGIDAFIFRIDNEDGESKCLHIEDYSVS
jgi:hypothetical protein